MKTWHFAALVLITFCVYANTLDNSFMWDDEDLILQDAHIKGVNFFDVFKPHSIESFGSDIKSISFFDVFKGNYWKEQFPGLTGRYRPFRTTTFAFDYFLWKDKPFGYHLSNLLLHTVCVVLVWIFGLHILKDEKAAFISALLFAVLPVHTESVAWIKNRSDILCCIFYLLSFIFFVKNAKQTQNLSIVYRLSSIVCFILALLSKEMAVTLPLVILLYIFFYKDEKNLTNWYPYLAVLVIFIIFRKIVLFDEDTFPVSFDIPVIMKTYSEYVKIIIYGFELSADRSIKASSYFQPEFIIVLLFLAVGFFAYRNSKRISFLIFWFFITLLPVSNIISLAARPIAEQRLYIPSVGFSMLLGLLFSDNFQQRLVRIIFIFLTVAFCVATFMRNTDWRNATVFWEKAVKQNPLSSRAHNNLGKTYHEAKMIKESLLEFQKAAELDPKNWSAHYNLAMFYEKNNLINEAIKEYETAVSPTGLPSVAEYVDPRPLVNLGVLYEKTGKEELAKQCYEKVLSKYPREPNALYNLGFVYVKKKQFSDARPFFEKVVSVQPANLDALNNLGIIYNIEGKKSEAIAIFERAISVSNADPKAYFNLGIIYMNMNEKEKAGEYFEKVIELEPLNEKAKKLYDKLKK